MRRHLHHLQETTLTGLAFLFGLQLVKSFLAGLEALSADLSTLAAYGLALALVVTAVHLARVAMGPRAAVSLTAGGLALVRVAEQVVFTPDLDLALSAIGTALFVLFVAVYSDGLRGRGVTTGALFGLGAMLGLAADTAMNGALGGLDLSWRNEGWASAIVVAFAGLLWALLWPALRRPAGPSQRASGGVNLPLLALGPVLLLELFVFQDLGRQTQTIGWDRPAVFAAMAMANVGGVAFASYVITLRSAFYLPVVLFVGTALVALVLATPSGAPAAVTVLLAQMAIGLTLVLAGMALAGGRGGARPTAIALGAAAVLLVAAFLLPRGAAAGEPYVVDHRVASVAAAVAVACALAAAFSLTGVGPVRPRVLAPSAVAILMVLPVAVYWVGWEAPASGRSPVGTSVAGMESFDQAMISLMRRWEVPGAALAVAKDGRLVLARGYGLADVERREPVQPDSLFRIASVSKPITAAAVLKLVEEGRLELDAGAFDLLGLPGPTPAAGADPRTGEITVRHLLQHAGGWDRDRGFDPMFSSDDVAGELGLRGPADCESIVRFMLGRRLDFDPGSRYAYSNFGYCLLGRIVEQVTGRPYADHVRETVLEPAGITGMRMGRSAPGGRAEGEVRYYPYPGAPLARSVFPDHSEWVPPTYGGFYLEAMAAHGGWLASAIDLVKFVTALDGRRHPGLLSRGTVQLMVSPPPRHLWLSASSYYALGWSVEPTGRGESWWHSGSLEGSAALLVRSDDGLAWAALFNSLPKDGDRFLSELNAKLWRASYRVEAWPDHDFFKLYGP